MSQEKGIVYGNEPALAEVPINPNEVAMNLQNNGVVLGHSDSHLSRSAANETEDSLNSDSVIREMGTSGVVIDTTRDEIDNLDQDPHVAHFLETQSAS